MLLSAQRARANRVEPCVDCGPWHRAITDDIQQASDHQSQVNLRSDQYNDASFFACRHVLKRALREEGYYVWEEKYVPKDASIAQDEDWQHWVTVDWSNSWSAWWYNTKDLWGLLGVNKAWN